MKKLNVLKTIQLVILTIFTVFCGYLIFFQKDLYHAIAEDPILRLICALLWSCLLLSYVFILMDFHFAASYKKNYQELYESIRSDPVSGLGNRNSCDDIIDRYRNRPLPEGIGCIMFDLTSIREVNARFGYNEGNRLIRDFSNLLKLSSLGLCFVGRNGGNKFLAIYEDGSREKIDRFLAMLREKVDSYNASSETKFIRYSYGVAFNEGEKVRSITELVSLSNNRISESK